jgi:hypothetical protein
MSEAFNFQKAERLQNNDDIIHNRKITAQNQADFQRVYDICRNKML